MILIIWPGAIGCLNSRHNTSNLNSKGNECEIFANNMSIQNQHGRLGVFFSSARIMQQLFLSEKEHIAYRISLYLMLHAKSLKRRNADAAHVFPPPPPSVYGKSAKLSVRFTGTHRPRERLGVPGRSHRDLPIRAAKHPSARRSFARARSTSSPPPCWPHPPPARRLALAEPRGGRSAGRSTGPCAVPSESRARALRLSLSRRRAV